MVVCNQEAQDALKNYIKTFDITKFPGKNVPIASLCLKPVTRALGEKISRQMQYKSSCQLCQIIHIILQRVLYKPNSLTPW
jgi:hypothetical protein